MTQPVRAHWHHFIDAAKNGYLFVPNGNKGDVQHALSCPYFNVEAFGDLIEVCDTLPYMVFDDEILRSITNEDVLATLADVKRAGVFRLPFETMIVELPLKHQGGQDFVVLRDRRGTGSPPWHESEHAQIDARHSSCDFYGIHFGLRRDEEGPYALIAPSTSYVDIDVDAVPNPMLRVGAAVSGVFVPEDSTDEKDEKLNKLIGDTYVKSGRYVGMALFCAVLVLASRGLNKEVIETSRLNRTRKASGKPAVPRHIYVHIGRTYRRASSDVSDVHTPRKSPRPHFVRGFTRSYHTGADRKGPVKYHYIPAEWRAWRGDETQEEMQSIIEQFTPTYKVRK